MGDLNRNLQSSSPVTIAGGDEQHLADVIQEGGINKLQVKATLLPDTLPNLKFLRPEFGGSANLAVNGGGSPVTFTLDAPTAGNPSIVISELRYKGFDNGIKIDNFMALNSELNNGIITRVTTNGDVSEFPLIKRTADFEGSFAYGVGGEFLLIVGSGNDYMSATFSPRTPFKLMAGTADKIEVVIQDNLSQVGSLELTAFGFEETT